MRIIFHETIAIILFILILINIMGFFNGSMLDSDNKSSSCYHSRRGQFLVPLYVLGCYLGEKLE